MALTNARGLGRFRLRLHTILNLPVPNVGRRQVNTDTIVLSPVTDRRHPRCHNVRRIAGRRSACLHVFNGPFAHIGHHVKMILYCTPLSTSLSTLHSGTGEVTRGMRMFWDRAAVLGLVAGRLGAIGLCKITVLLLVATYSPGIIARVSGICPSVVPASSICIVRLKSGIPGATRAVNHVSIMSQNASSGYHCSRILRLTRRTAKGGNNGKLIVASRLGPSF